MKKTTSSQPASRRSLASVLLTFLGSMNLAITLLLAVSIAAVIGTVLQQNQPYADYIIKFGPFWFEVFNTLGLYDVYSTVWFLLILVFLVLSTTVCIYRNAPVMIREMTNYGENIQLDTLKSSSLSTQWTVSSNADDSVHAATKLLKHNGFSARLNETKERRLVSGMKGAGSRLGYIFTHAAIVLICIGGLIDGNAALKFREMAGLLVPETQNIPANEVPEISQLGMETPAFRGNVSIPEGGQANVLFINYKDGYLVQNLPFSIELKDFRIEHYESGMPKSFESDLLIHDKRLTKPLEQTISVNHPLIYDGYSIYQASFNDGGSLIEFTSWPFSDMAADEGVVNTAVGKNSAFTANDKNWILEVSDFRLFNINPSAIEGKKFENVGPSVQFKVRSNTGEAKEYLNYMLPMQREDAYFYLTGVRSSPAEEFHYFHIPVDDAGGIDRFMRFQKKLGEAEYLRDLAQNKLDPSLSLPTKESVQIVDAMVRLAMIFKGNGFEGVVSEVEANVPEDKREEVTAVYVRVLQQILGEVYVDLLVEEGIDISKGIDPQKTAFFDDATAAISAIGRYGSPLYFQLKGFEHRQASGLQITKSPGKNLVYPGCALLILGVFLMFYAPQRRLWVFVREADKGTEIVLSGTAVRNKADFVKEYEIIRDQFNRVLKG